MIPNLVYAPEDQRWSALDARPLYSWCKPVGYLYNAQLRYELTCRLGVRWSSVTKGMAEMQGFSHKLLRAFSTRRREIETKLEATGRSGRWIRVGWIGGSSWDISSVRECSRHW